MIRNHDNPFIRKLRFRQLPPAKACGATKADKGDAAGYIKYIIKTGYQNDLLQSEY
ncbi:MAG: hypothetical protein M3342_14950 [Bacteroidota bacterium]|nr:hypothetical protein [Flavisolibacter sp.]MBD0365986.1 hypothetical protein [Flavisolibacter sp.]MBD0374578.1 hypothetical protein [Flavisolibacter sp.]MDQ3845290.1 hypothetical protein [Bacteroidota bacterium]